MNDGESFFGNTVHPSKRPDPVLADIVSRDADGIFLGGTYDDAYNQFLIAHYDRRFLLALLRESREALTTAHQTTLEVGHAQEVGSNWYTRGSAGLYNQVAMWVRKGREATAAVLSKLKAFDGPIYCPACGARHRHDCKCTRFEIPLPENDVD